MKYRVMLDTKEDHTVRTFTLNVITSGRQTITVSKDAGTNRVSVRGIDPEMSYGQEDLADLALVLEGAAKLLR